MERLDDIRAKMARRQYEFSRHALDRMIRRGICVEEVEQAFRNNCEIVEDYPEDKYGSSLLVLGMTNGGRALHVQVSYPSRPLLKIITLYEPDPGEWINLRIRRRQENTEGHE
jgi:hypothetical protein